MKIVLCVSVAFALSFFALIYLYWSNPDPLVEKQEKFYAKELESQKEKLFLLGASHVGQLNTTRINETVSKNHENYLVYNLAYNGDNPKKRLSSIEQIIALKPKIVFYGISYRDFESKIDNNSVELLNLIKNSLKIDSEQWQFNPKFITLQAVKNIFGDDELFVNRQQLIIPNTPFFVYNIEQLTIIPNSSIDELSGTTEGAGLYVDIPEKNGQLANLKKILGLLAENDIKIVLFIVPLHQTYLDDLPDSSKNNFGLIIEDIQDNYDVKIYNYTSKYSHLDIWANPDHIAFNKTSSVYSDDVSQMILGEIDP
jgi:hypothetical protein